MKETWQQLKLRAQSEEESRKELQRGMPTSPSVTYFRLEVRDLSRQQLLDSALFCCVLVPHPGALGQRPWALRDGFVRFPRSLLFLCLVFRANED